MRINSWDTIPDFMRCDEVRPYYDVLARRRFQLAVKRMFDVVASLILIVILAIPMLIIAVMIRIDSPGKVLFRQKRVTQYGKLFYIHKFRTMVQDPCIAGTSVTAAGDPRITKVGRTLRDRRLDELPQLFDILSGNMSFVGTRPEVPKYVKKYSKEMLATLLLPAGVTSEASLRFKDEANFLAGAGDIDKVYVEKVLPEKMKYNLKSIREFSVIKDIAVMIRTVV